MPEFNAAKYGTIDRDVTYSSIDGLELKMDVYYPSSGGPWPGLIFVHGGAFTRGLLGLGFLEALLQLGDRLGVGRGMVLGIALPPVRLAHRLEDGFPGFVTRLGGGHFLDKFARAVGFHQVDYLDQSVSPPRSP